MVRRVDQAGRTAEMRGEVVLDDQDLLADCIRILRASGELGQLRIADTVQLVAPITPIRAPLATPLVEPVTVDQSDMRNLGVVAGFPHQFSTDFNSAGIVNNPAAGAVLADSGPIITANADTQFKVIITADVTTAIDFRIQHRDAADAANVIEVPLLAAAGDFGFVHDFGYELAANNERIRVVAGSAMTGNVAAALFFRPSRFAE